MYNREPVFQTGSMEFERNVHIPGREGLTKKCIMGYVGSSIFMELSIKDQDILPSPAPLLTICLL